MPRTLFVILWFVPLMAMDIPRPISGQECQTHLAALSQGSDDRASLIQVVIDRYLDEVTAVESVTAEFGQWTVAWFDTAGLPYGWTIEELQADARWARSNERLVQSALTLAYFDNLRRIDGTDTALVDSFERAFVRLPYTEDRRSNVRMVPDLVRVLAGTLEVEERPVASRRLQLSDDARQVVLQYEAELDGLLRPRLDWDSYAFRNRLAAARAEGDFNRYVNTLLEFRRWEARVREVTRNWIDRIAASLPAETAETFRTDSLSILYAEIYQPTNIDRLIERKLKAGLSDAGRAEVRAAQAALEQLRANPRRELMRLVDEMETASGLRAAAEAEAAYLLGRSETRESPAEIEFRERLRAYRELGADLVERIEAAK